MKIKERELEALVEQIENDPDEPIVLPDEYYKAGRNATFVFIDGKSINIMYVLYDKMIAPFPDGHGMCQRPGVPDRNINPLLAVLVDTPGQKAFCEKGHPITSRDRRPKTGRIVCMKCRQGEDPFAREVSQAGSKRIYCHKGHLLVERASGERRCYECAREKTRRYRERIRNAQD